MSYTISIPAKDASTLDGILSALQRAGIQSARVGLNPAKCAASPPTKETAPVFVAPQTPVGQEIPAQPVPGQYAERNKRGPDKHGREFAFANGIARKGISCVDLVMEILNSESRVFSLDEIEKIFVERLFAASSAEATLSVLTRAGKVRRVALQRYCVPGLVIHK